MLMLARGRGGLAAAVRGLHTVSPIFSGNFEPLFSQEAQTILRTQYQQKYLDNLNTLTAGTQFENFHLELLVKETAKNPKLAAIFNNASQAWSNEFFLHLLANKETQPSGSVEKRLKYEFGGVNEFKEQVNMKAEALFGNGWVWVVEDHEGHLKIQAMFNAGSPLVPERLHRIDRATEPEEAHVDTDLDFLHPQSPDYYSAKKELLSTLGYGLSASTSASANQNKRANDPSLLPLSPVLCINLWEHAYFHDYRADKSQYLARFWKMLNWDLLHQYIGNWKAPAAAAI